MSRHISEHYLSAGLPSVEHLADFPGGRYQRMVDMRDLARILRRHRNVLFGAPLALAATVLLFVLIVAPRYSATATIVVDPREVNVLTTSDGGGKPVLSSLGTDDATIDSQVLLVQSAGVLRRVVEELNLTHDDEFSPQPGLLDPVKRILFPAKPLPAGASAEEIAVNESVDMLQRGLRVSREGTTFLIDVAVSSKRPEKAAQIANAIANAYFVDQVHSKYEATKIASDWLNSQITQLRARVLASEKAVEDFRAAHNLVVSQGVAVDDQQITDLNNRLIEARADTAKARAKYEQVQAFGRGANDPGSIDEALSSNVIARLRTQYAEITKNFADLTARYGPRHPGVESVKAQLRDTRNLINAEVRRIVDARQHDYQIAKSRETSLEDSLKQLTNQWTSKGGTEVRLRQLQRESEANRTIYESFLARYKETSAQESLKMPDSRIVTKASVPINPSFPKTFQMLALALTVGFGLGGILAFIFDYLDRRIKTTREIEEISGLPAIAAVPLLSSREIARLAKRGRWELDRYDARTVRLLPPLLQPPLLRYAIDEPASVFANQMRAIRLAVQRSLRIEPAAKVVVVTSAEDGEGKTTTAVNLALLLALAGIRTVLMDGDLGHPQLSQSLCPHAGTGLLDVASGSLPLDQAILLDRTTGLMLLPSPLLAGDISSAAIVPPDAIDVILEDLRQRFDVIIVDAPPVVSIVDGRALAESADRIIFATKWNGTSHDALAQAMQLLAPVQGRILGAALTQVDLGRLRLYDHWSASSSAGSNHASSQWVHEAAE